MSGRFRIRFTLRTSLILLTLVCCYFGFWSLTERFGLEAMMSYQVPNHARLVLQQSTPGPFVIAVEEARTRDNPGGPRFTFQAKQFYRRYYVWFLGWIIETPFAVPVHSIAMSGAT